MRAFGKLSALGVQKHLKKRGRYHDGGGLYLNVPRDGDGFWCFRYQIAGKGRQLGLGPVHSVSLVQARNRALEARQLLLDGRDPVAIKHEAEQARRVAELRTMTFREACEQFLQTDKVEGFRNDVHRKQWRSTLAKAYPVLGNLPLQSIDSAILLKVLLPILKATPETGTRLRSRIERVLEWARPLGLFTRENPARREALKDHLPTKRKVEHHAALPYGELPAFAAELRGRESASARALEFTILTAARTGEIIGMQWNEVDLKAAVWTVPASRMKAGKEHRVPLSDRAVELLRSLPRHGEHVFGNGKPLSNMALLQMLRGMRPGYTVHGFRSAFTDWSHEQTSYPQTVIDMALAHTVGDKVEAAYRRGDLFAKRAKLMQAWCNYLEAPAATGENVRPLRRA